MKKVNKGKAVTRKLKMSAIYGSIGNTIYHLRNSNDEPNMKDLRRIANTLYKRLEELHDRDNIPT